MDELALGCVAIVVLAIPVGAIVLVIVHQSRLRRHQDKLQQLELELAGLRSRLERVERPAAGPPAEVVAAAEAETPLAPTPRVAEPSPPPPAPPETELVAEPAAPQASPPEEEAPSAASEAPEAPQSSPPPRPRLDIDWEQWVGVRGAAVLGAVVAALTGLLFLKYSIETGLIPPPVRVALGYLSGVGALAAAAFLRRRRFLPAADGLMGTAIVLFYGSTWAAFTLYELIPSALAALLMAMTTVAGGLLSWRTKSLVTAFLGLLGGFATPLLLASGRDNPIGLFGYLLLLNVGVWVLAKRHGWPKLALTAQIATFAYQALWILVRMDRPRSLLGLLILGTFAVFYAAAGQRWSGQKALDAPEDRRKKLQALRQQVGGLIAPFSLGFYFAARSDLEVQPLALLGLLLLLSVAACWLSVLHREAWIALAAGALDLALLVVWSSRLDFDGTSSWQLSAFALSLALVFHLRHEWLARRSDERTTSRAETVPSALLAGGNLAWLVVLIVVSSDLHFWPWLVAALGLVALLVRQTWLSVESYQPIVGMLGLSTGLLAPAVRLASETTLHPGLPSAGRFYLLALFLGLVATAGALLCDQRRSLSETTRALHYAACALPIVMLALAMPDRGLTALAHHGVVLLLSLLVMAPATRLRSGALFVTALLLAVLNLSLWSFDVPESAAGDLLVGLLAQGVAVLLFTLWPFATRPAWVPAVGAHGDDDAKPRRAVWIASALAAPLWFPSLRLLWEERFTDRAIGLLPVLLGAVGVLALAGSRRYHLPELKSRLAWFGGVALSFLAVAIPLQLDKEWITVGWSLEAAAILLLWLRVDHAGLKVFALVLHTVVAVRLLLNPEVLSYHSERGVPILNWLAYTYLVPAASLLLSARILDSLEIARRRPWEPSFGEKPLGALLCGGLAILVTFAWINLTVLDFFSQGRPLVLTLDRDPARDLTLSIAWTLYAMTLLALGVAKRRVGLRWVSLVFLLLALGKVFLYDLGELQDLYRVASLAGLAMSLICVSLLYQRFVFSDRRGGR